MVQWAKENNLIKIMLRDCLHQPQYVDKMEKIIRYVFFVLFLGSAATPEFALFDVHTR